MCFFVQTNHTRKELLFLMFKEINLRNHSSLHKLFYSLESQEVLLAIIDNLLYLSIKENNYNYVDYLISNAEKLPIKPQFYFYQSVISFYKHLANYHFNSNQDDVNACQSIIKSMELTGMQSYGTELEEFLKDHI